MMLSRKQQSAIDEMEQLLDHVSSFEHDLNKTNGLLNQPISEEYKILKEYLEFRIHDMESSAIMEFHKITHSSPNQKHSDRNS